MLWIIIIGLIYLSVYQFNKNFEIVRQYCQQKVEILKLIKEIQELQRKISSLKNRIAYIKQNGVDYHED